MLPRFHAPAARQGEADVVLPDDEGHHATRVMRLKVGDDVAVFDGRGHEWHARIAAAARGHVRVTLLRPVEAAREPRTRLRLLHAVLKGDHMDAVVRDVTMVGIAAIVPVVTTRTVARMDGAAAARATRRWERVALASAKQCGRSTLPEIDRPQSFEAFVARLTREAAGAGTTRLVLTEPSAGLGLDFSVCGGTPEEAFLAVGPEGGWTSDELAQLQALGFAPLTLGALTLRADAAAAIAVSVLRATWRDL